MSSPNSPFRDLLQASLDRLRVKGAGKHSATLEVVLREWIDVIDGMIKEAAEKDAAEMARVAATEAASE